MRKSTPAISFAMAAKAPPITRMRIGVERPPALGPRPGRLVQSIDDVAVPVDLRLQSGRDHRGRVVLLDDRGPDQPVPGAQESRS